MDDIGSVKLFTYFIFTLLNKSYLTEQHEVLNK